MLPEYKLICSMIILPLMDMSAYVGKLFADFHPPPSPRPQEASLIGGGMEALVPGWYTKNAFTGEVLALWKYSVIHDGENQGAIATRA
jgi:hypothetical protein